MSLWSGILSIPHNFERSEKGKSTIEEPAVSNACPENLLLIIRTKKVKSKLYFNSSKRNNERKFISLSYNYLKKRFENMFNDLGTKVEYKTKQSLKNSLENPNDETEG